MSDYRELLKKYMDHVTDQIADNFIWETHGKPEHFTNEEWEALNLLDNEITKETGKLYCLDSKIKKLQNLYDEQVKQLKQDFKKGFISFEDVVNYGSILNTEYKLLLKQCK
jgi:hypothetical protein